MDAPKKRAAHIADLITACSGRVCTVDGSLDGMKRMVEFMVNRRLLDFQLLRAVDTVMPALVEQFPWLADLTPPDTDGLPVEKAREVVLAWLDQVAEEHGLIHHVQRLPEAVWEDRDPLAEFRSLAGADATVIAVVPTGASVETFTNPEVGMFRNPPLDDHDD